MLRLMIVLILSAPMGPAFADALEGKPTAAEVIDNSSLEDWRVFDQEELLYIELERGRVIVALSPALAQKHVAHIKKLARENFYDGLSFYRVIDSFVAQGGDVFEKRETKSSKKQLKAEFSERLTSSLSFAPIKDGDGYAEQVGFVGSLPAGTGDGDIWHLHCTGAIAMARGNDPDSAGTEFYITLQPQRYLDRNLTVFGQVVDGMEHVQAIRRISPPENEGDDTGEAIRSIKVGADLPAAEQKDLLIMRAGTETFDAFLESRRNRPEEFFHYRPDHIDICAVPVPVRELPEAE